MTDWVPPNCKDHSAFPTFYFPADSIFLPSSFPRREDVDRSNRTRISRLETSEHTYTAHDGGTIKDPNQREKMLANFMAPGLLRLRVDAQVMLIKNIDDTLVNGSMGKVVRFMDPNKVAGQDDEWVEKNGKDAKKSATVEMTEYPVVEFAVPGGKREMLVIPETWKVELPNGEVQVSRLQVRPCFFLFPSWASLPKANDPYLGMRSCH